MRRRRAGRLSDHGSTTDGNRAQDQLTLGVALLAHDSVLFADPNFEAAVGGLIPELADRARLLRTESPAVLSSLLDLPTGHASSDTLLYGHGSGALQAVVSVVLGAGPVCVTPRAIDALTGLPTRDGLMRVLHDRVPGSELDLMFVNVDRLGQINARHGRVAGDDVLRQIASRILDCSRTADSVYRYGADEFVLVGPRLHLAETGGVNTLSQRIIEAVSAAPIVLERGEVQVTVSAGLVQASDETTPDGILQQADAALAAAKRGGGNRSVVFDRSLKAEADLREQRVADVRRAIWSDGFELRYQPIIDLATSVVVGHEALLRLVCPDATVLAPAEFMPHAESAGMMPAIGEWVLETAVSDLARHPADARLGMSINVSPSQFESGVLPAYVEELLARTGVDPTTLVLEVTETAILRDQDLVRAQLDRIASTGIRIALDDFGTGFSSLSHLADLPVDILKIDKSFVDAVGTKSNAADVASLVIAAGAILNCDVVAEGIETETQRRVLQSLGCKYGQGFLLGHPRPWGEPTIAPTAGEL